jgi:exodeoxyribonuclease VIII
MSTATQWTAGEPRPEMRLTVPEAEYHRLKSVSQSKLAKFIESPKLYHGTYVTGEFPEKTTAAMMLGTALHIAVLEPERFEAEYAGAPACNRSTTAGKKLYNDFVDASVGKTVLTHSDYSDIRGMADGVKQCPHAVELLELPRETELALMWQDEKTGMHLRAKLDALIPDTFSFACVPDVKSTKDPRPAKFPKSVLDFGYWLQAAMYTRAAQLYTGKPAAFAFIAVRSDVPYDCFVVRLDNEWQTAADRLLDEWLAKLKYSIDNDYWRDPAQDVISTLAMPGWARPLFGL